MVLVVGCTTPPASSGTTTPGITSGSSPGSIEVLPTIGTATLPPISATVTPTIVTTTTTTVTTTSTTESTTTSTTESTTTAGALALDVLGFVVVENEHRGGYARDLFGYPTDTDHDGCNTRAEVMMRDSLAPTTHSPGHCTVATGRWRSRYDGFTSTAASDFEIDHVVALKEAWDSGAWAWSASARFAYGNDLADPRTLRAVSASSNSAKSDKDPSNWIPADPNDICPYLADWVSIKVRWHLSMDASEYGRIRNLLRGPCVGTRIAPWRAPPVAVPTRA